MLPHLDLPKDFAAELAEATTEAFGADLRFAFVFGSFAKGFGRVGHDIDTFVCVGSRDATREARYLAWLSSAHQRLGCVVDERYPSEIVEERRLEQISADLARFHLSVERTNTTDAFDVVTWVEVLAGPKLWPLGDHAARRRFEGAFRDVPERWKAEALTQLGERGRDIAHEPPLFFIKNVYHFEDED